MQSDYAAWSPQESAEQQQLLQAEADKLAEFERAVRSNIPAVQDVLDWLEGCIELMGDVDSLGVDETTPDEQVKFALILGKKMKKAFQDKLSEFEAKYGPYIEEDKQQPPEL